MMPNAPPALSSVMACAVENLPGQILSACEAPRPDKSYSPAPSSANVIVRKKNRTTRPMFLRSDPMLMIANQ